MMRTCPFGLIGPKEAEQVACTGNGCMAWVETCARCNCPVFSSKPMPRCNDCPFNAPHCVRLE